VDRIRPCCFARRRVNPASAPPEFWGKPFESTRKQAGLTQEKTRRKSRTFITNFIGEVERANMETSLTSMVKIAKALDVRVRDLVADL